MFTLKHVSPFGGEAIYQGSEVTYGDAQSAAGTAVQSAAHVAYLDGREWKYLHKGVVYVMNDVGKTVATYDLSDFDALAAGQLAA